MIAGLRDELAQARSAAQVAEARVVEQAQHSMISSDRPSGAVRS